MYTGPITVSPSDPEFMSHHEFEIKNPRRHQAAKERAAHQDDPGREFPCRGTIRLTHRDMTVWTAQCDVCGSWWAIPRTRVDGQLLTNNRLRNARLPGDLATREYKKHAGNEAARAVCRILVERWGTDLQPHPPFMYGATGRGKTHLLALTGMELIRRRLVQVRYWTAPDLLAAVRRQIDKGNPDAFVYRESGVELLILDDLGAEQQTDWGRDVIHRIVDRRDREQLPLMGATNIEHGLWADVFGDRVASRLAGCTSVVEVTGDDWRERERDTNPGDNVIAFPTPDAPEDPDSRGA